MANDLWRWRFRKGWSRRPSPDTRRHARYAAHQALPGILQPRSPNGVARLREERVPEGRADERSAQRIVLGYVLKDHSEGTAFVEDAEGGAAQRIHRAPATRTHVQEPHGTR